MFVYNFFKCPNFFVFTISADSRKCVSKRDWAVNPNPYHLGWYACVKVNAYSLFALPIKICYQYLEETLLLNESRDLTRVRLNLIIFKQQCRFSRVEIY